MRSLLSHLVRYHRRLIFAIVIGLVTGLVVPGGWNPVERLLLGWNGWLWSYLILLSMMMSRVESPRVRELSDREDESARTVLITVVFATLVSVAAIVFELATTKNASGHAGKGVHLLLSGTTLLGGWILLPTLFTIHYARVYFLNREETPPLLFPDKKLEPTYLDFAYFSFTIAVAAQTSDVAIASARMRRLALAQSVLAFFFNLAILGLSINVAAGLLS